MPGDRLARMVLLHPLCGGIPPRIAWKHLDVLEERVLAAIRARS